MKVSSGSELELHPCMECGVGGLRGSTKPSFERLEVLFVGRLDSPLLPVTGFIKKLYAKYLFRSSGRWQRSSALCFLCSQPGLLQFGCSMRLFLILVFLSLCSLEAFQFPHKILTF